jgi:thiazole/oxazole-forming peptide maturase SagC family component
MELSKRPKLYGVYYTKKDEKITIVSPSKEFILEGKSVESVYQLLGYFDGQASIEEICTKSGLTPEFICEVIALLENKGLVKTINTPIETRFIENEFENLVNFLFNFVDTYEEAINEAQYITSNTIYIVGDNELSEKIYKSFEPIFKVKIIDDIESLNGDFGKRDLITVVDTFDNFELFSKVNQFSLKNQIKFIRVVLNNEYIEIGPLFIPWETACYTCYSSRVFSNISNPHILKTYSQLKAKGNKDKMSSYFPGSIDILISQLKIQCIKFFSSIFKSDVLQNEISQNILTCQMTYSPVLKLPNCSSCGTPFADQANNPTEKGIKI